jgi:hypothetical protein
VVSEVIDPLDDSLRRGMDLEFGLQKIIPREDARLKAGDMLSD